MNIVLFAADELSAENSLMLTDHRHSHLRDVLRVSTGQEIRVGQINGDLGSATVITCAKECTRLSVQLTQQPGPRHPYTIILALPRPKMLRRVLRTCAEFGVADIHLIHSYRVEKSYWQSPLLASERLHAALIAGLERSGDTLLPKVHLHRRFRPFIEDTFPVLCSGKPAYLLHPGQQAKLAVDAGTAALVLIGPEGGFIPFELELAQANGAEIRQLGSRIFSVDTAVSAALARELH